MFSVYYYLREGPSEHREAMIKKILNLMYRNVRKPQIPIALH